MIVGKSKVLKCAFSIRRKGVKGWDLNKPKRHFILCQTSTCSPY